MKGWEFLVLLVVGLVFGSIIALALYKDLSREREPISLDQCTMQDKININKTIASAQLVDIVYQCFVNNDKFTLINQCISNTLHIQYTCAKCFDEAIRFVQFDERCGFRTLLTRRGPCGQYGFYSRQCSQCIFEKSKEPVLLPCTGIKFS